MKELILIFLIVSLPIAFILANAAGLVKIFTYFALPDWLLLAAFAFHFLLGTSCLIAALIMNMPSS